MHHIESRDKKVNLLGDTYLLFMATLAALEATGFVLLIEVFSFKNQPDLIKTRKRRSEFKLLLWSLSMVTVLFVIVHTLDRSIRPETLGKLNTDKPL